MWESRTTSGLDRIKKEHSNECSFFVPGAPSVSGFLFTRILEPFAFEIALTAREGSAPQSGVDFGKNHVFSQNDSY